MRGKSIEHFAHASKQLVFALLRTAAYHARFECLGGLDDPIAVQAHRTRALQWAVCRLNRSVPLMRAGRQHWQAFETDRAWHTLDLFTRIAGALRSKRRMLGTIKDGRMLRAAFGVLLRSAIAQRSRRCLTLVQRRRTLWRWLCVWRHHLATHKAAHGCIEHARAQWVHTSTCDALTRLRNHACERLDLRSKALGAHRLQIDRLATMGLAVWVCWVGNRVGMIERAGRVVKSHAIRHTTRALHTWALHRTESRHWRSRELSAIVRWLELQIRAALHSLREHACMAGLRLRAVAFQRLKSARRAVAKGLTAWCVLTMRRRQRERRTEALGLISSPHTIRRLRLRCGLRIWFRAATGGSWHDEEQRREARRDRVACIMERAAGEAHEVKRKAQGDRRMMRGRRGSLLSSGHALEALSREPSSELISTAEAHRRDYRKELIEYARRELIGQAA